MWSYRKMAMDDTLERRVAELEQLIEELDEKLNKVVRQDQLGSQQNPVDSLYLRDGAKRGSTAKVDFNSSASPVVLRVTKVR